MAKKFDYDEDDEYCGLIGGEPTSGYTVGKAGPMYEHPLGELRDLGAEHKIRKLGELDMNELCTAREGSR